MLHDLLPTTDAVLKSLFAVATDGEQEAIRSLVVARQLAARASARQYRLLLYVTSLLLLGVLVHLGLRLRARAMALQRRAEFEHAIARISTRFINSQHYDITAHVESALGELAACIGADRAYFVTAGNAMHVYQWCRNGAEFPSGWPQRALGLASNSDRGEDGTIHMRNINRSARGNGMDVLAAAGLHSWLCISSAGSEGAGEILGFNALQAGGLARWNEFGLVQLAFDAIANAVRREVLEQDKERLEASLHQARRMETIGALTSGIAHNFNNIVGAILGFAEMAHAHVKAGSRPANSLGEIRRAGERARDLVDQILTFGRRGAMRRERICVKELIAETRTLLEASLPHHISLMIHETSETTMVAAEPAQLQQVILNVCNNAAQAMDEAGTIEIMLEARETESALRMGHDDLAAGRYTIISIVDTGRGMDEATRERIIRAVLHHATRRKRARPGHGTRDRPAAWRSGERAKQPWGWYAFRHMASMRPARRARTGSNGVGPNGPRVRRDGAGPRDGPRTAVEARGDSRGPRLRTGGLHGIGRGGGGLPPGASAIRCGAGVPCPRDHVRARSRGRRAQDCAQPSDHPGDGIVAKFRCSFIGSRRDFRAYPSSAIVG